MKPRVADPRVLIIATEPCWVCEEESDRQGGSALNLCNVKRIRAHAEYMRSLGGAE